MVDLVTDHFSMLDTMATENIQIFCDLITVVGKKKVAAWTVFCLRDDTHKYEGMTAELKKRTQ